MQTLRSQGLSLVSGNPNAASLNPAMASLPTHSQRFNAAVDVQCYGRETKEDRYQPLGVAMSGNLLNDLIAPKDLSPAGQFRFEIATAVDVALKIVLDLFPFNSLQKPDVLLLQRPEAAEVPTETTSPPEQKPVFRLVTWKDARPYQAAVQENPSQAEFVMYGMRPDTHEPIWRLFYGEQVPSETIAQLPQQIEKTFERPPDAQLNLFFTKINHGHFDLSRLEINPQTPPQPADE